MSILVTGGAGYIGSHTVYALLDRGDTVVVLDNLSTGVRAQVGEKAAFVQGDIADTALVKKTLSEHKVDAVIHFAGSMVVADSVADPLGYYENNVVKSRALVQSCIEADVRQFIFSSTSTVYAEDAVQPLLQVGGARVHLDAVHAAPARPPSVGKASSLNTAPGGTVTRLDIGCQPARSGSKVQVASR